MDLLTFIQIQFNIGNRNRYYYQMEYLIVIETNVIFLYLHAYYYSLHNHSG